MKNDEDEFKRLLLALSDRNRCLRCRRVIHMTIAFEMLVMDVHCFHGNLHSFDEYDYGTGRVKAPVVSAT